MKAKGLAPVLSALTMALLFIVVAWQGDAKAQQPDYIAQCSNGIAVLDPQNNPALVEDCAALLALKDVLTADSPLNWSADTSIEEWSGVVIESTLDGGYFRNKVVALELYDRLTGSMPPELGNLSNLQRLYLYDNQLTGSIPPELGNLSNLERLYLYDNQLTGSIPPELGNLSNLERLYLHDNQLTGSIPPELGNLSNLQRLYLSDNQLTGSIPPELGNLFNLERFRLNTNQLTGSIPHELGNLTKLFELLLAGNQLTGCIPAALGDVREQDFGSLGLPICDYIPPSPTPTAVPTRTPAPTSTPIAPVVPDDVLNRLSAMESLLATLQSLISALESRITALDSRVAALESDAPMPQHTPTPTEVPGQPPTTTPTPSPTPVVIADACTESIGSGEISASWDSACPSTNRHLDPNKPDDGDYYARYYTFRMSAPGSVTIKLTSSADTFLYLLEGTGRTGAVAHENDDHATLVNTERCADVTELDYTDSCITASLDEGDYTIEVTTYASGVTDRFALTVRGIQ